MDDPGIICEKIGRCGVVTFNRPLALNALTLAMVREMACALDSWESDEDVLSVAVKGAGERAFCAGGDLRILYDLGRAGRFAEQLDFWREEYILDRRIKFYPKPYVALADGIVMGAGAGLSVHGRHFVVGDAFSFAMPEVGIGFIPDIGATFFLPRLPRAAGRYLALTGARIGCGDALAFGLATAYAPPGGREALLRRLIVGEPCAAAIEAERASPPAAALTAEADLIEECFSGESLAAILRKIGAFARRGSALARAAAETLSAKSPTSLAIALRQMQIGGALDLDAALRTEFRIVSRLAKDHDFYEGVRAVLIDRDNRPVWRPSHIEAIEASRIESYFAPLPKGELELPPQARSS